MRPTFPLSCPELKKMVFLRMRALSALLLQWLSSSLLCPNRVLSFLRAQGEAIARNCCQKIGVLRVAQVYGIDCRILSSDEWCGARGWVGEKRHDRSLEVVALLFLAGWEYLVGSWSQPIVPSTLPSRCPSNHAASVKWTVPRVTPLDKIWPTSLFQGK